MQQKFEAVALLVRMSAGTPIVRRSYVFSRRERLRYYIKFGHDRSFLRHLQCIFHCPNFRRCRPIDEFLITPLHEP